MSQLQHVLFIRWRTVSVLVLQLHIKQMILFMEAIGHSCLPLQGKVCARNNTIMSPNSIKYRPPSMLHYSTIADD